MGIGGLLPLLKSIQVQQHLSDFSGKTVAVDAYVWLHRGVFTCAPELATGKPTSRYVEYVMQKVRLLRHHGITPYIVFDGGPLPAKRGTEVDRKARRAENKAKGDVLARQGRHKEAREYYCKSVDVTPQMAYQVIKALRAENVDYVVAPYEADAQLAFLEREGIVQGIISEDSDLLVFGCKRVLYKLDPTSSTFTGISSADLGAVSALRGWTAAQFRAMAVLAGGDYLPSVPGVGIKTANTLVRKHRGLDGAVRALKLDAKYNVPRGYLEQARRAERVYVHQRVFDPAKGRVVHLSPIPDGIEWTEADEALVGEDIDPELACAIARGDACPVNREPMVDINPSYTPRRVRPLPLEAHNADTARVDKGKGKATMLNFLVPAPKAKPPGSPRKPRASVEVVHAARKVVAGRASGKRTLADAHELDAAAKRAKHNHGHSSAPSSPSRTERNQNIPPPRPAPKMMESRFFSGGAGGAGPSRRHSAPIPQLEEEFVEETEEEVAGSDDVAVDEDDIADAMLEEEDEAVTQEDGYLSPGPSLVRCTTPDLSSPTRPGSSRRRRVSDADEDVLSSPERARPSQQKRLRCLSPLAGRGSAPPLILAPDTPTRVRAVDTIEADEDESEGEERLRGPVLFDESDAEDIETQQPEPQPTFGSAGSITPSPPIRREVKREDSREVIDVDSLGLDDVDDIDDVENTRARHAAVANGWWAKFSAAGPVERGEGIKVGKPSPHGLRRNETTVTPTALRSANLRPQSAPGKVRARIRTPATTRTSLVLSETRVRPDIAPVRLPAAFSKLRYNGS